MADQVRFELKEASYARCLAFLRAMYNLGPQICAQELTAIAFMWQREVVRHMPVANGLARNSVAVIPAQYSVGTVTAAVGSNVEYVPYLEFGTDWHHPKTGTQMGIAGGRVAAWTPGQPPILDWKAKEAGFAGKHGQARREAAMQPSQTEFMPPFRGSWPLIVDQALARLRRRLALAMRDAVK